MLSVVRLEELRDWLEAAHEDPSCAMDDLGMFIDAADALTELIKVRQAVAADKAWLPEALPDTVMVAVRYSDGHRIEIGLDIESDIVCRGDERMYPGVVYRPNDWFGDHEDVGEVIAYGINEGRFVADTIDADVGGGRIEWTVLDVEPLRRYGIID